VIGMSSLEICMLGKPTITLNNKPILGSISNKAVALLCYLVLNKDKTYSRDKLASIFWDSANIDTIRYNLRYTLWSLRKILDADKKQIPFIVTYKDCCRINQDASICTDIFEMEKLLEESIGLKGSEYIESLNKIKDIYKGEFLEGFYINKCPEFNDWVFFERERLQRIYFEVLHRLTKLYKSSGNYFKSIEILNEMLKINPLQEELYEELIKNYLELGDRGSALKQFKRCSNILRDELNISPNESIRKLHYDIINSNIYSKEPVKNPSSNIFSEKLRVIFIDENKPAKKQEDEIVTEINNAVRIVCCPKPVLSYSSLSDCVRMIIDSFDHDLLRKLPQYYWKDISRIESGAYEICSAETNTDNLTPKSEKIRIFKALEKLFNVISANTHFCINIKQLQWIDDISMEFLTYYISRNKYSNIAFILEGHEVEPFNTDLIKLLCTEELS
jgi:DNA-binding SARP family transcriptional activator